ncbi:hypothetical protein KC19_12G132500 [Ceratodon purpureus]|uniref:Uncharacterized protein n=1 Tax=Ceratodon purpureus TaxID=3225 RepID=A0A8T0G7L6_CERPU|nr:hypothetical protein KC19_12G132500 [Ceratodon purpureus]
MGSLSLVCLVLSILTILYDVHPKLHDLKKPVAVITASFAIYLLALDCIIFVRNPYPLRIKIIDLLFRNVLGSVYKNYKSIWCLQKWWPSFLRLYCNPFTFSETFFEGSRYMVLVQRGGLDFRTFDDISRFEDNDHRFSVSVRNMEGRWGDQQEWMELVEEGAFLQEEGILQQQSTVKAIADIYTRGVRTGYDVLYRIQGECADYNCLFRIFCAWSWFETEPDCGVVDIRLGGLKNGVRYIHTVDLDTMHRSLECGDYILRFVHHENHGFCVGGG